MALAAVLLLSVAAGGAGYAFRNVLPIPETWKVVATDWAVVAIDWSDKLRTDFSNLKTMVAGERSTAALTVQPVAAPAAPVAPPADDLSALTVTDPEVMIRPESSIYLWLQDWAAAMRSKDPVAQASYYASTVDRYLDETAVSRDAVFKAKKDAIADRPELWSVKVEHPYVESQGGNTMTVRAVKRILARTESGSMSETRMKVRLKVVRADGTWQIVEEQELGPPGPSAN